MAAYSTYEVKDELVLPEGFTYEVIAAWGDRVGDSRFGYNNDYLSLRETSPDRGLLTVNFEYISAFSLPDSDPLKSQHFLRQIAALLGFLVGIIPNSPSKLLVPLWPYSQNRTNLVMTMVWAIA